MCIRVGNWGCYCRFVFVFGDRYVAMLLTSWGSEMGTSSVSYDLSTVAMWIKIASLWVTIILYTWCGPVSALSLSSNYCWNCRTLVAPVIFKDRDFGFGPSDD